MLNVEVDFMLKMENVFQTLSKNSTIKNDDIGISGIEGCKIDVGFLSREKHLKDLFKWFEKIDDQYNVVVAPAGYGKTNLLLEFI